MRTSQQQDSTLKGAVKVTQKCVMRLRRAKSGKICLAGVDFCRAVLNQIRIPPDCFQAAIADKRLAVRRSPLSVWQRKCIAAGCGVR
jgi:hypothetical protein